MTVATQGAVTRESLSAIIRANMDEERAFIRVHDAISELLHEKWNGKKLNKRFADQVKARLFGEDDSPVVYFDRSYDQLYIRIWGKATAWPDYEKRHSWFIGYGADAQCYDPAVFADRDLAHGKAARERNQLREEMLADTDRLDAIVSAVNAINEAKARLEELIEYPTPDRFEIEHLVVQS